MSIATPAQATNLRIFSSFGKYQRTRKNICFITSNPRNLLSMHFPYTYSNTNKSTNLISQ